MNVETKPLETAFATFMVKVPRQLVHPSPAGGTTVVSHVERLIRTLVVLDGGTGSGNGAGTGAGAGTGVGAGDGLEGELLPPQAVTTAATRRNVRLFLNL
jgi:hypothetical protein